MGRMPEFGELPLAVRVQLVAVGPLLLGAVCGFMLGETAAGWWIGQAVAAVGGVAGGLDHRSARDAAVRGLIAGLLFGLGIVAADAISGDHPSAEAPEPIGAIVPITAITGSLFAALGARLRARSAK